MKLKSFLFVVAAVMLVSCMKARVCKCTYTDSTGQTSTQNQPVSAIPGINSSKKSQESYCKSNESSDSYSTTTCELTK